MTKRKPRLPDSALLDTITRLGGKVTATELSQVLGYPDRTIRYRMKRLREKGYLGRLWPQTLDTKLGLGDAAVVLGMSDEHKTIPRNFLDCFPNFYAHYASFGRYNGFQVAAGFPIGTPQTLDRIIRSMKQMGIIKDAYVLQTLDFIPFAGHLHRYNPETGWNWDWREWIEESEKTLKIGERSTLEFDQNPAPFDYDHKDIEIIAQMKAYGSITHRELSKRIGLSETQIGMRIRQLKDAGVLRGFAWLTEETPMTIILYTFFEIEEPDHPVFSCFLHLPFRKEIIMDSSDRFCVRITMNSSDVLGYLRGLETLRPHFRSYFVQTCVNIRLVPGGMYGFYNLHNESTGRWEMPVEEYIQSLEKFLEKY
ncbi:MAG: winged helix-turn-helix transcriptional regulator [Candidatus Thorarchaeota archaeon]